MFKSCNNLKYHNFIGHRNGFKTLYFQYSTLVLRKNLVGLSDDTEIQERPSHSHTTDRTYSLGDQIYHVLQGDVQKRCRELIMQICDAEGIEILKGGISKDHVHMHIEYAPKKSISDMVERIKGRTSRMLQQEFPKLKERYWDQPWNGRHFWAGGYGAWSTGNITDKMVDEYLEHHHRDDDGSNFIIRVRGTFSPVEKEKPLYF